jgi:hypothetical protein
MEERQEMITEKDKREAEEYVCDSLTAGISLLNEVKLLEARIAAAKAELINAKKGMGGLARISFQKHIDAALKALE